MSLPRSNRFSNITVPRFPNPINPISITFILGDGFLPIKFISNYLDRRAKGTSSFRILFIKNKQKSR
jgi:hypothetical protein